jgi:hypothetical protein
MLRRIIAAVALVALACTPLTARTRLVCRYTGLEIAQCEQPDVPAHAAIEVEECCLRQGTHPPSILLAGQQREGCPPVLHALPVPLLFVAPPRLAPIRVVDAAPRVFLITRALLI